jgi:ketosteroid isomerase-like protein
VIDDTAARWRTAFAAGDVAALGALLDDNVRWGGPEETPQTCHSPSEVLRRLAGQAADGVKARIVEVVAGADAFLVELYVSRPQGTAHQRERSVYQVLTVRDGLVTDIRGYLSRAEAAAHAGLSIDQELAAMQARALIPILNVSSLSDSFEWFARLGWAKKWAWGDLDGAPTFAALESGALDIFLCQGAQGPPGMWLSVWVDDVDTVHAVCMRHALDVIRPPQDEPWGVREMHVRHPDGHVLRISQAIHRH